MTLFQSSSFSNVLAWVSSKTELEAKADMQFREAEVRKRAMS
jgi:hypothetical protein